jgi:hypothetical protein
MTYDKHDQLNKERRLYRDHTKIWDFLKLSVPASREESEARRFGKCACPSCPSIGTEDRPLDLHHIVPRSHSKQLIKDFTNHLYLCGDFFPANHHKALHGEMTPGRRDWLILGIFGDVPATIQAPVVGPLTELARQDQIARTLLGQDPMLLLQYAQEKGIIEHGVEMSSDDSETLRQWMKNRKTR